MDLYTENLELLYQKYNELTRKDAFINKKLDKKQKEQERKSSSIQILSDKLNDLRYVEDVLRGKYKKEDKELRGNILKVVLLPILLALLTLIVFLLQMPMATVCLGLLLVSCLCATNYIKDAIQINSKPLKQRKRIMDTYDLDAVLVEIVDLVNTIKDQKKDMTVLEEEQKNLHTEKEKIAEIIDLVDEGIFRLQEAKEKAILHLTNQGSSIENKLNMSFQNNKNVLKLIKMIEKEEA